MTGGEVGVRQELIARLTAAYKLDYFDQKSVNFQGAKDLLRRAVEKGWSAQEFLRRLDRMTEQCKFPTWTPADFFTEEREKLYNPSWAVEEQSKDHTAQNRMEAYQVGEKTLWRYIPDDENALEGLQRVFFRGAWINMDSIRKTQPEQNTAAKSDSKQPTEETNFASLWAKSEKKVVELEERLHKMALEKDRLRIENDGLRAALEIALAGSEVTV